MDRPLPKNHQAELAIISGMMQSEAVFFEALSRLNDECFCNPSLRACWEHFKATKNRDHILVEQILGRAQEDYLHLEDLYCASFSTTGKTEIELLLDCYRRRKGLEACYNAINAYYDDQEVSAIQTTSQVVSKLSCLSVENEDRLVRMGDMLPETISRHEAIVHGKSAAYIKTGFKSVDDFLAIMKHHYAIIGARPSNGKSTFAGAIARNVAKKGGNVLSFLLDSSKEAEIDRAIFSEAGANLMTFNLGYSAKRDMPKIQLGYSAIDSLPLYIDDSPNITPIQIQAKAQRLKSQLGKLDLITVDFVQNVNSGIKGTPREQLNYISYQLHSLPKIIGCPVIVLSQLTRYPNEESEPPSLGLLKETGNLEADADIVLLLWYPEKYHETPENRNQLNVYICKNKDGRCGSTKLNFFADIGKICDRSDQPEEPGW